jgi:ATP-dependent protease HslVU (ClpYQ) peptidase subunit
VLRTVAVERQAVIDGLSATCAERMALIERLDRELRETR